VAVGHDLLGQPGVRNDGEAEMDEVAGRMGESAQLVEAGGGRAAHQLVDDPPADTEASRLAADNHRSHFRDRTAQRREFGAREHLVVLEGNDETVGVDEDFSQLARQEMSLGKMLVDQLMDRVRFMGSGGADGNGLGIKNRGSGIGNLEPSDPGSRIPNPDKRQRCHACTSVSTAANTSSRMSTARSRSATSMVS